MKVVRTLQGLTMGLAIVAGSTGTACAAVIVNDDFSDGNLAKTGAVDANWTAEGDNVASLTLGVENDPVTSSNALRYTTAGGSDSLNTVAMGRFDEVSLVNVGDVLTFSFDVRGLSFNDVNSGFRWGIYHDNGEANPAVHSGYRVLMGTGATAATNLQAEGPPANAGILGGTNREFIYNMSGAGHGLIADNNVHSFEMVLERTTDGVLVEVFQDGVSISGGSAIEHLGAEKPIVTSFNEVVFGHQTTAAGEGMQDFYLDNVSVEVTPIPEPMGLILAGLGIAVLVGMRRKLLVKPNRLSRHIG